MKEKQIKVELINHMNANDKIIADIASICYGKQQAKDVARLINTLIRKGHTSVFEHTVFTFKITLPIFAARQLMRHRIASYTERSSRYSEPLGFYKHPLLESLEPKLYHVIKEVEKNIFQLYKEMESVGISREVARIILPQSQMTELYMTINLRSLFNFLTLRISKHAQHEIRQVAILMLNYIRELMPITHAAWERYLADKSYTEVT